MDAIADSRFATTMFTSRLIVWSIDASFTRFYPHSVTCIISNCGPGFALMLFPDGLIAKR